MKYIDYSAIGQALESFVWMRPGGICDAIPIIQSNAKTAKMLAYTQYSPWKRRKNSLRDSMLVVPASAVRD